MKPVKKGDSWDVFESWGSTDGRMQIQAVECPDTDKCHRFKQDHHAIQYVLDQARKGNEEALDALWQVLDEDGLVNRMLWCEAMGWTGPKAADYPDRFEEVWGDLQQD